MKPTLYLETTVVSYLVARPSDNLVVAAHQQVTHQWWNKRLPDFQVVVSQFVLDEAAGGDAQAARERLNAIQEFPILDLTEEVGDLAAALLTALALPAKAATDAAHIALAAVHEMHFLLTWNCTHIANAEMAVVIENVCRERGFSCPVICTPEELMGI